MKKRQIDYERKIQRQQDIQEKIGKSILLLLVIIIIGMPIYNFLIWLQSLNLKVK